MSNSGSQDWNSIVGLVAELKRCDELELTTAAIAMAYICIDTIAGLARPAENERVTRSDFKQWVDRYLKCHPEQPYKYKGEDVYAARCAFLHSYGSEASLHKKDSKVVKYVYHDGGKHNYDKAIDPSLAIIGIKSFINDVVGAVNLFMEECHHDLLLKQRVEPRLAHILQVKPIDS